MTRQAAESDADKAKRKRQEPIGTKEAEAEVADKLNKTAHKDTKRDQR